MKKVLKNKSLTAFYSLKVTLVSLIIVSSSVGKASFVRHQIDLQPGAAHTVGLLGTLNYNPAWIAYAKSPVLVGAYTRLFNLRELESGAVLLVNSFRFGEVGVGFQTFGNELYSEQTYSLVYGKSISENGLVGLTVNEYQISISGYGSARSIGIDIGTTWQIAESVNWELAYLNINGATIGKSKEPLPQQAFTGFSYQMKDKMLVRGYLLHELDFKPRYGVFLNYQFFPWLTGALNTVTDPVRMNMTVFLQWKLIGLFYGVTSHPVLPFSHSFGILLEF